MELVSLVQVGDCLLSDRLAFQGHGYLNRIEGRPASTRILRFEQVTELTVRDLFLIDSPTFALTTNNVKNARISGITVRAQNLVCLKSLIRLPLIIC
jgi:polygalacturonase